MPINTNPFRSLAGTAFIQIDAPNTDANAEMMEIGTINYEFDLIPTNDIKTAVGMIPSAVTAVFDDYLSNRGSLYEALFNSIGNYDGFTATTVPVAHSTLYLLPRGETNIDNANRFQFDLRFADVAINERSKQTTLRFSPRTTNLNVGTWQTGLATNNFPTPVTFRKNASNITDAYLVGDFIYDIISEFDTGAGNQTIYETINVSEFFSNPILAFPRLVQAETYANTYPTPSFVTGAPCDFGNVNSVMSKVSVFAGMEGAIFGTGFGYNFYVNRRRNNYNVEIDINDVAELSFVTQERDINAVALSITNTNVIDSNANLFMPDGFPVVLNTNTRLNAWSAASSEINVTFSSWFPQLNYGEWQLLGGTNIVNADPFAEPFDIGLPIYLGLMLVEGDLSTALATGALVSDSSLYKISVDILGVDKIKPHEVLKFNNTVPLRYQGKHFRPTSLAYDLVGDRVKVTAYQIDSFPVVEPVTNINVNVGACESGLFMVNVHPYGESTNVNIDETGDSFNANAWVYGESTNVNIEETNAMTAFDITNVFAGEDSYMNGDGYTNFNTSI